MNSLPTVSARFTHYFAAYSRHYLRRRFHALRILQNGSPRVAADRPLVVYLNHAAWCDPLVCLLLSREYTPHYTSFAPIDAAMLERYAFFKRLGFFAIEPHSTRGALQFLRTSRTILADARHALWLTPQGRFTDVRERPLCLQEGLGALAVREPRAVFIPLAIEYAFWTESRPEILTTFGEPLVPETAPDRTAAEWTRTFAEALAATQDTLAIHSQRRDFAEWRTLDRGKSGAQGIYDAWGWLRARWRGEKFSPEHRAEAAS
jgi:1-acyl-sn-glycerol-3-phosphate acyltransferase